MKYNLHSGSFIEIKTVLAHIVIFFIMLILISIFSYFEILNNSICILIYVCVLGTYLYSGYIITNSKAKSYKYFYVAFIGLLIWMTAFLTSPNSINYKSDTEADIWMIYRYYIAGIETPINFISNFDIADNYSITLEMYLIALHPIIASLMQYFGGQLKFNKLPR